MLAFVRNLGCHFLKVLCWGCLALLLAGPASAQEKTEKKETAPPVEKTIPEEELKTMSPDMKEVPAEALKPREEMQLRKGVDRKFGGQEIRAQEEQKEQKEAK